MRDKRKRLVIKLPLRFLTSHISSLNSTGQALITLLFFIIISVTIVSTSALLILMNSLNGARYQQGELAYEIAQSGMENAELRLLRDTNYTGEVFSVGSGTATITVTGNGSGTNPFIVTSTGTVGNYVRKVQATVTYTNNLLTASTPMEVF
jgi:Tfp pilus assembly protein PilX